MIKSLNTKIGPEWTEEDINKRAEEFINQNIDLDKHEIISHNSKLSYGVYSTPEHCGEGIWCTISTLYKNK